MTDPLGRGQVLSYLEGLSAYYKILLISCEKKEPFRKYEKTIREICEEKSIEWYPVNYTKSPPVLSGLYDIRKIRKLARKLFRKQHFSLVHCRSYMASLVGLYLQKKYRVKFIFDMRGFWVDEKIENTWDRKNPVYRFVIRYFRKKEKLFYEKADAIVTLTESARKVVVDKDLSNPEKINVVPTCVNLHRFQRFDLQKRLEIRKKLGIPEKAFVLLYSGGYGPNYDTAFVLTVYNRVKKIFPDACLLILSKDGVTGLEKNNDTGNLFTISLPYAEVGDHLMAGDLGLINYAHGFSVAGRSPTKLGEYWATGLAGIAPPGIGDVDSLFTKFKNSGIIYNETTFENDLEKVQATPKEILRGYAETYFSLEKGVELYRGIYNKLLMNE